MNKVNQSILFFFLFSPLISYVFITYLGLESSTKYFRMLISVYVPMFVIVKLIRTRKLIIPSFIYPLILYLLYNIVWSLANGDMQENGALKYIGNNIYLQMILLFIVIFNTHYTKNFIKASISVVIVTVFLAFIVSLIQVYSPSFMNVMGDKYGLGDQSIYELRRSSIFGYVDDNELGLTFIPMIALLVSHLLRYKSKYILPLLIISGVTCVLSNSRYVIISFVIVLIMIVFHYREQIFGRARSFALAVLIIVFILYGIRILGYDYTTFYEERLFAEGSIDQTSRYIAFQTFATYFPNRPWFGTGIRTFEDENVYRINARLSSQVHVGYLDHLIAWGIFGSLLMFSFWFMLAYGLRKSAKISNYWGAYYAMLTFLWANATLVKYSMFYYGLIYAIIFGKYYLDSTISSKDSSSD